MAYGSKVTTAALKKFTARTKKRRTANTTKIKYQRPNARNQRTQIMSNAQAIKRLYQVTMPKQVYCDWQYAQQAFADVDAQGNFTRTWKAFPLMSFGDWNQCLRQDPNTFQSSQTMVERLCINMRYQLGESNYAYFNVFIVTLRKDASNRDPPSEFASGVFPQVTVDYIESPTASNIRLNSALYKVHYASYHTLTDNNLTEPTRPQAMSGNPFSTWRKGQCNIKCKANIRQPSRGLPWRQLPYQAVPYYKRYFMLVQMVAQGPQNQVIDTGASFAFDQLSTTINTS